MNLSKNNYLFRVLFSKKSFFFFFYFFVFFIFVFVFFFLFFPRADNWTPKCKLLKVTHFQFSVLLQSLLSKSLTEKPTFKKHCLQCCQVVPVQCFKSNFCFYFFFHIHFCLLFLILSPSWLGSQQSACNYAIVNLLAKYCRLFRHICCISACKQATVFPNRSSLQLISAWLSSVWLGLVRIEQNRLVSSRTKRNEIHSNSH